MYRKICCLVIVLFISFAFPSLIHADNQTVFGPKSFEISKWHIHASVHTFNVADPGEGIVTITKNTPDHPISGGFILLNTTVVPLRDFLTGGDVVFEKEIALRSINFITVFLRGTPGASITITINAGGTPVLPPEVTFSADPPTFMLGESSALSWNVIDANNISIAPGIGSVDPNGSYEVFPTETTTYTLTAVGPGGTTTETVTVSVNIPLPTVSISADPEAILLGESSTLTWSSTYADTCAIEPGIGSVDVNGSISVSPTETTIVHHHRNRTRRYGLGLRYHHRDRPQRTSHRNHDPEISRYFTRWIDNPDRGTPKEHKAHLSIMVSAAYR